MQADRLLTSSLRAHPGGHALAEIMAEALASVDPAASVRRYLRCEGSAVVVGDRRYELSGDSRVIVVGGGKAGAPMAQAAYELLGDRIMAGLVVVKEGHLGTSGSQLGPITLCEASHPVPDQRGMDAAERMVQVLEGAREQDLVLVLLSGGASALMTLPALGVSLGDMQGLTGALLRCGASIGEINTLRKHCSRVAGGQLALYAAPAQVAALIVSDVVGSPLDVIASGPTVPDPTTYADAWAIVERYRLEHAVPPAVIAHLRAGAAGYRRETPKADAPIWQRVSNHVIASNATAADTAAAAGRALGFHSLVLTTYLEGEAREVGKVAAALAREVALRGVPLQRPALIIAGGETTVTLRGDGLGGRNQELALGAVNALADLPDTFVIALATDGGDGPTDAAGAVVTGNTWARARSQSLDPAMSLQQNDAYHFFAALDDLLRPGPTLTNVNDLLLIAVL
jgi:hydroxypyruvate reductase